MCGIVGFLGPNGAVANVLEGLKRLEYRGYDSSGVSFATPEGLRHYRKTGKLKNLVEHLAQQGQRDSTSCIGHTRWATHGKVTEFNAHPHQRDGLAVVHNGIIENFQEIKKELQAGGISFSSETDTEVFLELLHFEFKQEGDLLKGLMKTFAKLKGNSAFVVYSEAENKIYSVKRSAPLVVGQDKGRQKVMVSSDPYALVGFCEDIYFPEDEVFCVLKADGGASIEFFENDGSLSSRYQHQFKESAVEELEKGDFEHYMLKEIHEQPKIIREFAGHYFKGDGRKSLEEFKGITGNRLHISACGTAWHAGLCIRNLVEKYNGIPTDVELASEFRYRNPIIGKEGLGVFISQSGETADTLAAQELCHSQGLTTLGIVNVEGSTLFRNCDKNLLIHAGREVGVASTKAFTQMVLTGFLASRIIKGELDSPEVNQEVSLLATRIEEVLNLKEKIHEVAESIFDKKGFLYTGRGIYYPIALEGALKLKEIAYVHAEGYASGELKHGPIALIDADMVNIAIVGPELYEKTVSNIEEIKARKGIIVVIGPNDKPYLEEVADHFIPLNFKDLGSLSPLYVNVVTQLLAYYVAKFKGTDIDQPRNLAKSVTVE